MVFVLKMALVETPLPSCVCCFSSSLSSVTKHHVGEWFEGAVIGTSWIAAQPSGWKAACSCSAFIVLLLFPVEMKGEE